MRKLLLFCLVLFSVSAFAATCGNTNIEATIDTGGGYILESPCTLAAGTWTVSTISFYYTTATTNHVNLAIFNDSAGQPGTLLCETGQFTATTGWNTVAVGAGCSSLGAGTYHIASLISDGTRYYVASGLTYYANNGSCCVYSGSLTWFSTSASQSLYFTYSAAGGGTTRKRGHVIQQ